ncbi:MAG: hypothetical protein ABR878_00835 [Roseiarcus sp.]|jgi:hypothetical protein
MTGKAAARRAKARGESGQERLDATPERLAHARESGQRSERGADRLRRLVDPFDVMRSTRALAPHDAKLNDIRWLIGEALRRLHRRAQLDSLRAVVPDVVGRTAPGPRAGLPASEIALHARDKLRAAAERAGEAAWPIVARIVIEGARLSDCRACVPEIVTPWRADAILADRLRVALDRLGDLLGVTAGRR